MIDKKSILFRIERIQRNSEMDLGKKGLCSQRRSPMEWLGIVLCVHEELRAFYFMLHHMCLRKENELRWGSARMQRGCMK